MGAPPREKAKGQRANPSGIPMLYLASDPATALWEIRGEPGSEVSLATVVLKKDIQIVDLTNIPNMKSAFQYGDNLQQEISYRAIFRCLSDALSEPIQSDNSDIDYVPTQYLSEAIKASKFGGMKYKSSLSPTGWNCVLFNVHSAKATKVECQTVPTRRKRSSHK